MRVRMYLCVCVCSCYDRLFLMYFCLSRVPSINFSALFLLETLMWSRPSDTGTLPCPRAGHSCVSIDSTAYFFGGADVDGQVFNDVYSLDTGVLCVCACVASTFLSPVCGRMCCREIRLLFESHNEPNEPICGS